MDAGGDVENNNSDGKFGRAHLPVVLQRVGG